MCGIIGCIQDNQSDFKLQQAIDLLKHRGPDVQDSWKLNSVSLAHVRLSILDLSTASDQPMISKNGRFVLVFNGEIYNYKQLAEKWGLTLRTRSDTEVLLEGFSLFGTSIFSELNGMFSFAIYDQLQAKIVLCRDQVGIKPLFYYQTKDQFVFASEIKAMKPVIENDLQINQAVIHDFLCLGYIPHPETIYKGVNKLDSGSFIEYFVDTKDLKVEKYNDFKNELVTETLKDEKVAKKKLNDVLLSSVERQLMSDVPLGTFLSGGIDSSLVTALASQFKSKINTFSIGFEDAKHNESGYADKVAKKLNTTHHPFILKEKDAVEKFDSLVHIYDEPFVDTSAIPSLLVAEKASKEVKMVLAGDGGDELFFGYGMYNWANRLNKKSIQLLRKPIKSILERGDSRSKRAAKLFDYKNKERLPYHIFSQEQYLFSEKEVDDLMVTPKLSLLSFNTVELNRELSAVEQQAMFDFNHYLKDDLLVKVDRASMQHSLEVRVPLLDKELISFAFNLDESLKHKNGESKYLLKQVLYDYLPAELFDRPKWGFSVPLHKWLKNELSYLVPKYLNDTLVIEAGFVKPVKVKKYINAFIGGDVSLYNRIWALINLHQWYKEVHCSRILEIKNLKK